MTISGILGFIFVLFFAGLIIIFSFTSRKLESLSLREIPAFTKLRDAVGSVVEAGTRLHLSLGRGEIIGPESSAGFVGLSSLARIGHTTADSDLSPVATSGTGPLGILSQDTFGSVSRSIGTEYDPLNGRVSGLTPFSYAAGVLSTITDESIGVNILIGNFGSEVALITEAGERANSLTVAGTDNITAQAILYASAQEPLIGEETYASGAYLGAGASHTASLRAQDLLRWVLIFIILIGAVLKLAGVL
jgi:hypothetical protein